MDKKRRNNYDNTLATEISLHTHTLHSFLQLENERNRCGILYQKFLFLKDIGIGYIESYKFDGLDISILDLQLEQSISLNEILTEATLELSFLLEGEQIIELTNSHHNLIFESQENYMVYLKNTIGVVTYSNRKRLKEIKIRMNTAFINRYGLDTEYKIVNNHSTTKNIDNFAIPIDFKKQKIITEILSDTRTGLLKRLFLEAKVLELIALQLDHENEEKPIQNDNLLKKLYKVQFIINSDLATQHAIPKLAREVGINDFLLKKEFKRVFKQTVFEYATQRRMEAAKKYLENHKMPIYEISELVGFKNPTHFSAAFKKNTGLTPNKYRKVTNSKSLE